MSTIYSSLSAKQFNRTFDKVTEARESRRKNILPVTTLSYGVDKLEPFIKALQAYSPLVNGDYALTNLHCVAANMGKPTTESSFIIDKGVNTVAALGVDGVTLDIMYNDYYEAIEIWMIHSHKQGSGLGTSLMNDILDVAEDLGLDVVLVPCPYVGTAKSANDSQRRYQRLVSWYKSLGFEHTEAGNPTLIFKA